LKRCFLYLDYAGNIPADYDIIGEYNGVVYAAGVEGGHGINGG
jgi:hypothetical protein